MPNAGVCAAEVCRWNIAGLEDCGYCVVNSGVLGRAGDDTGGLVDPFGNIRSARRTVNDQLSRWFEARNARKTIPDKEGSAGG